MLAVWQTGVLYQLIHALGLLAVAWLSTRYSSALLPAAGWLMFAGTVAVCICWPARGHESWVPLRPSVGWLFCCPGR
ncbi:PF04241 domain protein [Bordetella holmesii CDC-H635-BH]|uniref:PF04241 domain protein n=2 Tax=Bordetella holmesii TaxID=35814 RepID=A0A158MAF7_9BORD|nr:PF04241 domain protein [Bordetella holmesii H620]KAK83753.1 PF04241 domain protein [Bordetella holmesii CDC-H809-BH]KAK90243.1 PF04241 domain protein [Bordetella holmesii CDC-H635-BH]KAK99246.1 PF04241 domain protein [Bordetella holmesii CDC-H585-BH]KCV01217.1 PF04241 domain protein [Bordetella holmesii CDC-H719-BH]KCV05877.1 PF04241 domain protein [Bordetella holmesii CDC-H629-BH]KCV06960.1 PF04241 domain protein [Bordetella holmesii CDC-H785-BH]KCV16152.1 PF04241 domain protein [Bordete